jgi:hypothetical protein
MRGGKAGTPGRRVVVVGGGAGRGGAPQGGAKTLSDRFKALEKKGPKPGSVQRGAQNVQRTADKRFSKVCGALLAGWKVVWRSGQCGHSHPPRRFREGMEQCWWWLFLQTGRLVATPAAWGRPTEGGPFLHANR